jgi:hypothetical protein
MKSFRRSGVSLHSFLVWTGEASGYIRDLATLFMGKNIRTSHNICNRKNDHLQKKYSMYIGLNIKTVSGRCN